MARVVNAPAFLEAAARGFPGLDTRIGVRDDLDIPRNNGCYLLARGRCVPTEEAPDTVVTPGELASLFLDGEETRVRLMLDE